MGIRTPGIVRIRIITYTHDSITPDQGLYCFVTDTRNKLNTESINWQPKSIWAQTVAEKTVTATATTATMAIGARRGRPERRPPCQPHASSARALTCGRTPAAVGACVGTLVAAGGSVSRRSSAAQYCRPCVSSYCTVTHSTMAVAKAWWTIAPL